MIGLSGAFQENIGIEGNSFTFKEPDGFHIGLNQRYVILERKGNLYNWSGSILDKSKIFSLKRGDVVRITIGFHNQIRENLYLKITRKCQNGDLIGTGFDVYNPVHRLFMHKEVRFQPKHIIEIWE